MPPLKLRENFVHKIVNLKIDINNEIIREYLEYHNQSFLAKNLLKTNQTKNKQIRNEANDPLID